jgi:ankyrin repeat protein
MELPDVCLLLMKCRDFDAVNDIVATDGSTALHIACAKGLDDVVATLLKRPDFTAADAKDRDGFTALHGAAYNGHTKCVSLLLESEKFTDVDAIGEFDVPRPAAHWATKAAERFDMRTVLHMAAANGHAEIIDTLLGSRGSTHSHAGRSRRWFTAVNETNRLGATALHMAAKGGHTGASVVILRHQAFTAVNAKDVRGYTALHWSAQQPGAEICRAILAREDFTAIDVKNLKGQTAMDLGAEEGHPEIARAILARVGTAALMQD